MCHSMDRLARNLDDLRRIVLGPTEREIHIVFVKENLTFTGEDSPMSNLLLSCHGGLRSVRERADPRAPARRDCDRKAGREVQRQETVFDPARAAELRRPLLAVF